MSTPHMVYRHYDEMLKKHPLPTKAIAHRAHLRYFGGHIEMVFDKDTSPQCAVEIHKSGFIRFINTNCMSNDMWDHRMEKLFETLNTKLRQDPLYEGRITFNGGWQKCVNICSTTDFPDATITPEQLKRVKDYFKNQNMGNTTADVMNYIERGRYLPYSVKPNLSYKPSGWYGVVDNRRLGRSGYGEVTIRFYAGKTVAGMLFDTDAGSSQYPVFKGWKRKRFYKVMNQQGITGYAKYQWDMPTINAMTGEVTPGKWHEVEGGLQACSVGIHICTPGQLATWANAHQRNMLVEMETDTVYDIGDSNKFICRKARVKRVIGDLTELLNFYANTHGRYRTYFGTLVEGFIKGKKIPQPKTYEITTVVTKVITRRITVYENKNLRNEKNQQHDQINRANLYSGGFGGATKSETSRIRTTAKPV